MHVWWQALDESGEGLVNCFGIKQVVVVQDKDELVLDGGQLVEQSRHHRLGWRWLRGLERIQYPRANVRRNRLHSSDEVR